MNTKRDPKEIAESILFRSTCNVQVGSCISLNSRIISWGWNSSGFSGFGLHSEAHAIKRANKDRLEGATIYVASRRKANDRIVLSKPCEACQKLIDKYELKVKYRDAEGIWRS